MRESVKTKQQVYAGQRERSFKQDVKQLMLGEGEVFHGEGILAITKALLQAGVSYVGGYPGAPISHLMDVLADANAEILDPLGIHLEASANEAGAAAMLGASINYPLRGAVTWKSVVGTNVASDALSNLASAGVMGGALIIVGEDYGEGASVIQERSHAFAMKSSMWLLDPRPSLQKLADLVEQAFDLSEVSNTPVMLSLRIRACHVHGSFVCKNNRTPPFNRNQLIQDPHFDYAKVCLPPSTYAQEKHKFEHRLPAARAFISQHRLNETFAGLAEDVGLILQGGMYNTVLRGLAQLGLTDAFGEQMPMPLHVLNVIHPLVPEEIVGFCRGKKAVLIVEEGNPEFIEQQTNVFLRKAGIDTVVHGKDVLPMAGEYTPEVVLRGLATFLDQARPAGYDDLVEEALECYNAIDRQRRRGAQMIQSLIPARPPSFCTGCPERPVFSAIKLVERELGPTHVSADIGCHTFATLPPFNVGSSVLGYGMGLASSGAVGPAFGKRVISIMGDGGFWHNGMTSGVANAVFNQSDSILIVLENGFASATGQQHIPTTGSNHHGQKVDMDIGRTMKALGVKWLRKIHSYDVHDIVKALREAMTTTEQGLKVIIAQGECQLARLRRIRPVNQAKLVAGKRVVRTRFGVDEDVCTGDHSCIRLSGCPSLTIKPTTDPLRRDPVAYVDNSCVGCGLCGEVAHAAALCPSFYQVEVVQNPTWFDRWLDRLRRIVITQLQGQAVRVAT